MNLEELGELAAAAGKLTGALCAPWDGEPENDPTQRIIRDLVRTFYERFSKTLTDDHLRVLMHLNGCRHCKSSNLIKHVHNGITSIDKAVEATLRDEFECRIDFLKSHGLISSVASEKVCLSHLGKGVIRLFGHNRDLPAEKEKPWDKAFIGSSREGLPIARSLQWQLKDDLPCIIWDQGTVFGLGDATIEALESAVLQFSFGIFVFTPDDKLVSRNTKKPVGRDNVLFELGLFIGKLSRRRAFLVHPAKRAISLPSDLHGMATATYDPDKISADKEEHDDEALAIALGPVAQAIRVAVRRVRRASQSEDCA
jgi:predicted nucleotide-binding protein